MTRNRHRNSRVAHVLIKSTRQVRCVVVWSRHSSEEKSTAANTWEWVGTGYILARRPARRAGYALAKRSVWQMIWERAVLWLAPDRYPQRAAAPGACGQCPECGVCCNPFVNALHEWTDEEVSDMFLQWQLDSNNSAFIATYVLLSMMLPLPIIATQMPQNAYDSSLANTQLIHIYINLHTYSYTHIGVYLCISVSLCMRMHIYIYIYICIYISITTIHISIEMYDIACSYIYI